MWPTVPASKSSPITRLSTAFGGVTRCFCTRSAQNSSASTPAAELKAACWPSGDSHSPPACQR